MHKQKRKIWQVDFRIYRNPPKTRILESPSRVNLFKEDLIISSTTISLHTHTKLCTNNDNDFFPKDLTLKKPVYIYNGYACESVCEH